MAATCPIKFDVARLRAEVLATYDRVVRDPSGDFHFIPVLYCVAYRKHLGPTPQGEPA